MNKRGFTLIELLVAITIIMILGMAGLASYRVANEKSRDARRRSDLEQVRMALETYRENNSNYPAVSTWTELGSALTGTPRYIENMPNDPSGGTATYSYIKDPSGCTGVTCTGYFLRATLESPAGQIHEVRNPL